MATQWHPLFAELLRPLVEGYYDVQTNVSVGDAPRQADLVLLQRTARGSLPFQGLWKDLTTWNILEFKGPTVSARVRDLDYLVELGLGIDRRLHEERTRQRLRPLARDQVSFWYLANYLGRRFLRDAQELFGTLEPGSEGVWRCQVMQRAIYLVSSTDLPVDQDSLPLHLMGKEPRERELAVAHFLAERPVLWAKYSQWLLTLHPVSWEVVRAMARTTKQAFKIDLRPAIEHLGLDIVIDQIGVDKVIEQVGLEKILEKASEKGTIKRLNLEQLLARLTPSQRQELKRLLK